MRPLASNWYYCAQFIAKPKAVCALRLGWTATSSNFGLSANMTSSIKPELHNSSLRPPEEDRAAAVGNTHRKWWRSDVKLRRYDRAQTNTQTHTHTLTHTRTHARTLITLLCSLIGDGYKNFGDKPSVEVIRNRHYAVQADFALTTTTTAAFWSCRRDNQIPKLFRWLCNSVPGLAYISRLILIDFFDNFAACRTTRRSASCLRRLPRSECTSCSRFLVARSISTRRWRRSLTAAQWEFSPTPPETSSTSSAPTTRSELFRPLLAP